MPRRPLRRKPKELDEAPTLYAGNGAGGGVALPHARGAAASAPPPPRRGALGATGEEGELIGTATEDGSSPHAAKVHALAAEIAERLAITRPRPHRLARRGRGEATSVPYRGSTDELDLDRTFEALIEHGVLGADDLIVRERRRVSRTLAVAIDVSGSMRGERVMTAAASVGALASEFSSDQLAVIAFWSDAALLLEPGRETVASRLVEALLRLPAEGLTNVAFALEVAGDTIRRAGGDEQRVLLLSDCLHNAGADPRSIAARLPRLDVLLDVTGEHDAQVARELAGEGRGQALTIRHHREVAPALSRLFS